jgi:hypothetical protein
LGRHGIGDGKAFQIHDGTSAYRQRRRMSEPSAVSCKRVSADVSTAIGKHREHDIACLCMAGTTSAHTNAKSTAGTKDVEVNGTRRSNQRVHSPLRIDLAKSKRMQGGKH